LLRQPLCGRGDGNGRRRTGFVPASGGGAHILPDASAVCPNRRERSGSRLSLGGPARTRRSRGRGCPAGNGRRARRSTSRAGSWRATCGPIAR